MKLYRDENEDGCGKYAVINMKRLNETASSSDTFQRWTPAVEQALKTLEELGVLEWGAEGADGEFFVIKLKDPHARAALSAYAASAQLTDPEFAAAVAELANRSGPAHPLCKSTVNVASTSFLPKAITLSEDRIAKIELTPMPQPDEQGRYMPRQDCEIHLSFFREGRLIERRGWATVINGADAVSLTDGSTLSPDDLAELDSQGWDQMIDVGLIPGALVG